LGCLLNYFKFNGTVFTLQIFEKHFKTLWRGRHPVVKKEKVLGNGRERKGYGAKIGEAKTWENQTKHIRGPMLE